MKIDFISDINRGYETVLSYPEADKFIIKVLWWHLGAFLLLTFLNSVVKLADFFPSPFAWRVINLQEVFYVALLAILATMVPILLVGKIKNHYLFRILVTFALAIYSYLFIFISGGSIEMHFHFFIIIALLIIYSDWRLGWIMLVLTGFHHGILNYIKPGWVYFYGRNDLSVVVHAILVLVIVIFTTVLCKIYKKSVLAALGAQEFNINLEAKVKERTAEVEKARIILEEKTNNLENSQKAMLNLLEDAKELENQLAQEKKDVERVVEERTKQLKEERIRLQASIDSLNAGFFIVNPKIEIVMINPVARYLLCLSDNYPHPVGAFVNKDIKNFECKMVDIEKELQGVFDIRTKISQAITEEKPIEIKNLEFRNRFIHIFISPIVIVEEIVQVIGAVVLIEDVTETKLLDRTRDEFFSIASHELRTPLTAIRGNTALIEQFYADKISDKKFKEMIDDIHESSIRLIEIVNDFLDASRLELGKVKFNKESIGIAQTIQDVIKEYQTTGFIKKLFLKLNPPKVKIPNVLADKNRIKQVLINLIGNAIKFTETGGVSVDLTLENKFVKVLVSDTGKGILEKSQAMLFKKFQQTEENIYTRDSTKGTGLGLYISRLIVEEMGGKIVLEKSEVGKGSIFSFTLPMITQT